MENLPNINPGDKIKKIYKAGVVDISALSEAQARDIADSRMAESKEDREKGWLNRTVKRIWKHNIAEEWYRQREIQRARKEITEGGNLYVGESKDASTINYEEVKKAIVERFTSEYEAEMLKAEEKDSKKTITDEKTKKSIVDLIKKFAGDATMSEINFKEEQKNILSVSRPEYVEEGKLYADNLLDIAREIRNSVIHGEKLDEMDFDVEITLGKARESLNTEAKHNTFEKIIEKTQNSKLGKYLFNEPAAVSIAAGLYSAGNFLGMKALRSKVAQWGTFGATAVVAGGVAAAKESARLNRERAQHARESAKGMEFKENDMKRREEMEKNRYETKNASELIQSLERDLVKISTENISKAELDLILINLSEIEARIKTGDEEKVDLITYSRFSEVEQERMNLDLCRAKIKVALRKSIADKRIEFNRGNDFDTYLSSLTDVQSEYNLSKDIEAKDKIFKSMKRRKVAGAFVKTVFIGAAAGFVFQEAQAAFQPRTDGFIEGTVKHFQGHKDQLTGKTTAFEGLRRFMMHENPTAPATDGHEVITEHVARNAQEYINKHPELTTKIHRQIWMDNNTPMHPDPSHPGHLLGADQNELRTQWGGVHGTGIDLKGKYVLNVEHMTNDGSFHKGLSVAAKDQLKAGKLELLLSLTKGLQHTVFKVPIDANGNAIIDPDSPIGQMMFQNQNGHAVFTGQFAEIGHSTGFAQDGGENMQILGTHIGTGRPGEIIENITPTPQNVPTDWDYKVPPFVPVPLARQPLEGGKYKKYKKPEPGNSRYLYMTGSENDLARWKKDRSPRLASNPDAVLSQREELDWYFKKQLAERGKGYITELDSFVEQNGVLKNLHKDTKIAVCMPVAAAQEFENIYRTLSLYAQQDKSATDKTVIIMNVNWPDDADMSKVQKTLVAIEKAREDFPQLQIATFKKVWPRSWIEEREGAIYGEVVKYLNDVALRAINKNNIRDDVYLLTNDADAKGMSKRYLSALINSAEKYKSKDGFLGRIEWSPELYEKYPGYHLSMRINQYLETVLRNSPNGEKNIASSGANFLIKSSAFAAVGGYNANMGAGADTDLGRAIKNARFGERKTLPEDKYPFKYENGAWIDTDPSRSFRYYQEGRSIVSQWSDFDEGGYQPRGDLVLKESDNEDIEKDFDKIIERSSFQITAFIENWIGFDKKGVYSRALNIAFPPKTNPTGKKIGLWKIKTRQDGRSEFSFTKEGKVWIKKQLKNYKEGKLSELIYKRGVRGIKK